MALSIMTVLHWTEAGTAHGGVNPGAHGWDSAVEAVLCILATIWLQINIFIYSSNQGNTWGPPVATHPGTAKSATDVANEDVLVTILVGQRAPAVTLEK